MKVKVKVCSTCGQKIFFKKNSEGKSVPFNVADQRCHFETCTIPKDPTRSSIFQKPKVSFQTIKNNKTMEEFA